MIKKQVSRSSLFILLVSVSWLLKSCQSPSSPPLPTHFSQNVMTIDYHISIGDELSAHQKEQIQQVIDATFREIDVIYNKWNPQSEISHLNKLSAHTPYLLSPQLNQFLQRLDYLVQLSEGRFDPTIEPIQQLWKGKLEQGLCPTLTEIEKLKPYTGWHTLHLANGFIYKEYEQTQLDLGGVAKGFCVDLLIERLSQIGLSHLYVEWGGEIRTLGYHPSKRPWRVYISCLANPDPSQALAYINLTDRALATSGDYFQYWKAITEQGEEKVFCHIFNPLTLKPLEVKAGSIASASLLALDCMTADALAKVLMLFDSTEEAQAWIHQLQNQLPDVDYWMAARSCQKER